MKIMDKLIRKELVGRVYKPWSYNNSVRYVIVGVRKSTNYLYNHPGFKPYEILIGQLTENQDRTHSSINVYSWHLYRGSKEICFDGRGTRKAISRCIKSGQYDKLHYHTGRRINMNVARIYESHGHPYEDYIRKVIDDLDNERG
jgi:hypothetical protein